MTLLNNIIERNNLLSAWRKVRNYLLNYEGWVDIESVYLFEADLDKQLEHIHNEFSKNRWSPREMTPLPRLKRKKTKDGNFKEIIRQDFWVPVIDQVAWVAVVNIIGPILDLQMPGWSFANRIYRSVFYEEVDIKGENDELKIGPYRHSPELLYRSWHKSWSLYRRLSYLTWISMLKGGITTKEKNVFSEGDKRVYQNYTSKKIIGDDSQNIPYLTERYWKDPCDKIFYAKIDLKSFYPLLKRKAVLDGVSFGLKNFRGYKQNEDPKISEIEKLVSQMLQFSWKKVSWADKEQTFLNKTRRGIPVGLYVSGFLSNVALLPIDIKLHNNLVNEDPKIIAHFRYVDDHIILAKDFNKLTSWILEYKKLLSEIGSRLNTAKTEPEKLQRYLNKKDIGKSKEKDNDDEKLIVDPKNPKEFFTQTLALISDIANKDFGLLHIHEQEFLLEQLKHLLVVPLEQDEIKNDTRMAFSIYRIIRLIVDWQLDWVDDVAVQRESLETHKLNSFVRHFIEPDFPNKEEYNNIVAGAFKNLLETAQQFPEKLRLWRLMIEYCRKTGYGGWRELKRYFEDKTEPQDRFLKAIVSLELGEQVLNAAKAIKIYRNLYSWQILTQTEFLKDVDKWLDILTPGIVLDSYERIAWDYLNNCVKLSKFIKDGNSVIFSRDKSVLYYWAEMNSTKVENAVPSELWENNILKLDSADVATKALIRLYPAAIAKLSLSKFNTMLKDIGKKKTAWEWDGVPCRNKEKGKISLVDWCNWTRKYQDLCNKKNLYDPRISEWTSLEIIKQLLEIYEPSLEDLDSIREYVEKKYVFPHPANFIIPKDWIILSSKNYTWQEWEDKIRENRVEITKSEFQIEQDNRIVPFWRLDEKKEEMAQNCNLLYGLGIILLGLLRKNFDWPARWNLLAFSSDWRSISKDWFSATACCSDTLFVLQTLLLPRHAESIRIEYQSPINYAYDKDMIYDPPLILSLAELKAALEKAQDALKKNRIDSFRGLPRQLIPVSIPDLIKREWLKNE